MTTAESKGRLLIVDDDAVFVRVLGRALTARGFEVAVAGNSADALKSCSDAIPEYAVLDLKLGTENGLALISLLLSFAPHIRILLLTGYASIATAVEAIKRGAHDCMAKPVDADGVVQALLNEPMREARDVLGNHAPPPLKRLEWEHIQRVLAECDGSVSEASRRLGLHRRTLQRKLAKRPVPESGA